MRKFSLIASVTLLMGSALTSTGPSLAADCTKGMLWPYVRAAGDCLTDAEIAAGQKGTYSGPTNMNVDVGAIKPADVPAQTNSGSGGNSNGALIDTSVFGASAPSRPTEQCRKGILWPFDREPGDCLTEREKQEGQSGVYGGAAATQASITTVVPPASGSSADTPQPAPPQAASCSKSWFWPFVKESGDCLSAGDKQSGENGVHGGTPVETQATTTKTVPATSSSSAAAPQPVPQAASCSKSWLWPFVRESGDCLSAAEKQAGGAAAMTQASATTTVPAATTSVPAATTTGPAASAASTQAPQAAQPAAQTVSCSKPLLWPFVKESGDCSSNADKKNGQK